MIDVRRLRLLLELSHRGTITAVAEEGRFITVKADSGETLRLRTAGDTVFEGIADRSKLAVGQKFTAQYMVPEGFNAALGYDILEIDVTQGP